MKNLIVYSLWGDNSLYWTGAIKNIELANKYFPDWICRFYIDKECKKNLIDSIVGQNVEVVLMKNSEYNYKNLSDKFDNNGLFWRFLPLCEEDVSIVLSRDCDSRITEREVNAVNQWISSDKDFHIMRDHPYHAVPILAGMWGARNGILRDIKRLLEYWKKHTKRGVFNAEDQDFLGQIVYPIVRDKSLEHSEFGINYGSQIHKFPTIRKDYEFVGDVFDINDVRHPDYWKIIEKHNSFNDVL
jgi:hypothetical protein